MCFLYHWGTCRSRKWSQLTHFILFSSIFIERQQFGEDRLRGLSHRSPESSSNTFSLAELPWHFNHCWVNSFVPMIRTRPNRICKPPDLWPSLTQDTKEEKFNLPPAPPLAKPPLLSSPSTLLLSITQIIYSPLIPARRGERKKLKNAIKSAFEEGKEFFLCVSRHFVDQRYYSGKGYISTGKADLPVCPAIIRTCHVLLPLFTFSVT